MRLEGVVTNVTNFGAFVDIGVHQDGLVHISQLADKFVSDPRTVVKAGDVVQVRVEEVDLPRKRIALTMRSDAGDTAAAMPRPAAIARPAKVARPAPPPPSTAMAAAFAKLKRCGGPHHRRPESKEVRMDHSAR